MFVLVRCLGTVQVIEVEGLGIDDEMDQLRVYGSGKELGEQRGGADLVLHGPV